MVNRSGSALLVTAVLCASTTWGRQADGAVTRLGQDYFGTGATVVLADPIEGDALLAGGSVESNASVGGDVTAAGGQVTVRATVGDDLHAAGGRVEVDARVAGSARIAGGRVRIAPEAYIGGGVSVAGGNVDIDGRLGRYLTVMGGEVTLGGDIAGDVSVYAESLTLRPGTRIGGRLTYRTANEVTVPPDVEILGGTPPSGRQDREPGWQPPGGAGWLWVAGLLAVGLILTWALAAFSQRTTRALVERPWAGLGIGLLVLLCVPAVVLTLLITLIGIPLALIVLLLYLAMLIAGYVVGALFLGDRLLMALKPGAQLAVGWRIGALLVALVVLAFLNSIPVIGGLVRLAVLLLGLGGIVLAVLRPAVVRGSPQTA